MTVNTVFIVSLTKNEADLLYNAMLLCKDIQAKVSESSKIGKSAVTASEALNDVFHRAFLDTKETKEETNK